MFALLTKTHFGPLGLLRLTRFREAGPGGGRVVAHRRLCIWATPLLSQRHLRLGPAVVWSPPQASSAQGGDLELLLHGYANAQCDCV